MKTGFTCPAGFNIVASATRGSQKLIVVVLGAPTVPLRTMKVSALFDRGFGGVDHPIAQLAALGPSAGSNAPDMRDQICRRRGKAIVQFNAEIAMLQTPLVAEAGPGIAAPSSPSLPFAASLFHASATPVLTRTDLVPTPIYSPVPVYIGAAPGYIGPVAAARPAHSPLGTEMPPATASAYAAPASTLETAKNPLKPDPEALPIKGRRSPAFAAKPKAKTVVAEKPEPAAKPAKKTAQKSTAKPAVKQAHSEKTKPAKTEHEKEHAVASAKSKTGKGVSAKAE
jgi:D-alanyl-D-alanine carboxypeptidase